MDLNKVLGRSIYYDKDGSPIEMMEWAHKFEDTSYRIVANTRIGDFTISTVWLGLDHAFGGGRPLIFETMVFPDCEDMYRYHTLEEARAGHEQVVAEYRAKLEKSK